MSTSAGDRADLAVRLLSHAIDLTRETGPDGVSLREVQRRSGVSPAAAYKHYRDRGALMVAVGQRASAMLADAIERAFDGVEPNFHQPSATLARLRAGVAAYIEFALREPGLYRAVFLTDEGPATLAAPVPASRGSGGFGPFQLLQNSLRDLADRGAISDADANWTDTAVWAASHGMALLLLDSPLRELDATQRQQAVDRLIDVILAGLASQPARLPDRQS